MFTKTNVTNKSIGTITRIRTSEISRFSNSRKWEFFPGSKNF